MTAWGSVPDDVPAGLSNVIAISSAFRHILALKNDGTIVGWGSGSGGATISPWSLTGISAIASGADHVVGLTKSGNLIAWGYEGASPTLIP